MGLMREIGIGVSAENVKKAITIVSKCVFNH